MFFSPRKIASFPDGDGGRALSAWLKKLRLLDERRKFADKTGGGEGGSMGVINTCPAMRDTLFCEDRRLSLGDVGERANGWIIGVLGRHGARLSRGDAGGVMTSGFKSRAGDLSLKEW